MPIKKSGNHLERWEIAIIKAMIARRAPANDQDILAYFTRPTRSINHRAIGEIRTGAKHGTVPAASDADLQAFLTAWPDTDPQTGLSLQGDELLIKAREAMIAAVHVFNSAGLTFRAELFIVSAVIAWTYFMHACFKKQGVDYRYYRTENGQRVIVQTPNGADKYWELSHCLNQNGCPVDATVKANLNFLLQLRHEIEHRSTTRIDDALSARLQACCLNFNEALKAQFGAQYALERRLPIALQFVTFSADQRALLKKAGTLPAHVETMMDAFDQQLTPEQRADPKYAYRVYMVHRTANRPAGADVAVELVPPGSEQDVARVILREVEKPKYLPTEIVNRMRAEGYTRFTTDSHTKLWKRLNAKVPAKGYGAIAVGTVWSWYDTWLRRVKEECEQNPEKYGYQPPAAAVP